MFFGGGMSDLVRLVFCRFLKVLGAIIATFPRWRLSQQKSAQAQLFLRSKEGTLTWSNLSFLLLRGVRLDEHDARGETALTLVAGQGRAHLAYLLVLVGADANVRNASGLSAFEVAYRNGHFRLSDNLQRVVNDI
jgi:ankyrin repeat protein